MRSVILVLSLGFLAGCATVSVVPGEATVETSLSANQSKLRQTSLDYCDRTVAAGWVEESSGVSGLAHVLMHGRDAASDPDAAYAARIGATTDAPALVLAKIASDAAEARAGLGDVTREADAVLASGKDETANRGDVMSFERALVRAQMSQRSFARALDLVAARADLDVSPIVLEIDKFASAIDHARSIADRLADHYAAVEPAAS